MIRILWLTFLMLSSCTTVPLARLLDRVEAGMDKSQVLELAGNPKRTFRERGQDHWIYIHFEGEREMSRMVVFDEGKVTRVTKSRAKTNWEQELENVRKSPDSGFKSIDGGADSP